MPYNIAVTSSDGKNLNLHFGRAGVFYILQIDEESGTWKILEKKELSSSSACSAGEGCGAGCGEGGHENMRSRIKTVADLLKGCTYLLTAKIGPRPSDLLKHSGITALEAPLEIEKAIPKLNKYHLKYGRINQERKNG
jgi:predicted Fe-Mo cluster-binding NifX family protein